MSNETVAFKIVAWLEEQACLQGDNPAMLAAELVVRISEAVTAEREACANIVQERAHHHEVAAIRTEIITDLSASHRDRAEALRVAEAMIRERQLT